MTKTLIPGNLSEIVSADGSAPASYLSRLKSSRSMRTQALALGQAASILYGRRRVAWAELPHMHWLLGESELAKVRLELTRRVEAEEISPSWANNVLAAVRGVVNSALDAAHRSPLPRKALQNFPLPDLTREPQLDQRGFRRLLKTCRRDMDAIAKPYQRARGVRDAAILVLARATCPRVSELSRLRLTDFENGRITYKRTKGGQAKSFRLPRQAVRAINDWLAVRGTGGTALFCAVNKGGAILTGRFLGGRGLQYMLARRCERAKIEPFAFHEFRRLFATDAYRAGRPDIAQKGLGHKSQSTTARYNLAAQEDTERFIADLDLAY